MFHYVQKYREAKLDIITLGSSYMHILLRKLLQHHVTVLCIAV